MNTHFPKMNPTRHFRLSLRRFVWALAVGVLSLQVAKPVSGSEHLPDGAVGKPGLQIWGFRTDITLDDTDLRGKDGAEFSSGKARILFPLSGKASLFASYRAENRLNVLHQARLGIRLRVFQPDVSSHSTGEINPDGPLGNPYFTLSGGVRLYENESDAVFGVAALEIAYPWTRYLTIGAGAELNTDTSITIVDNFFVSLSVYTARYLAEEPYSNPDGPVGYLNFRLSGGGSGEGFFGQLDFLFPLTDQMTIGGFVRGERVALPYQRSATLGARFLLYPGVKR